MKRLKQYLHNTSQNFVIIALFTLPVLAYGQKQIKKMETTKCHLKNLLCNNGKPFFIDYLFSIDSIFIDQKQLRTYPQRVIKNEGITIKTTITSYQLRNDSVIDIGITDSILFISVLNKSLVLNFAEKVNIKFIGYKFQSNFMQPFFCLNKDGCSLYFSYIYYPELGKIRLTEYDNGPSN